MVDVSKEIAKALSDYTKDVTEAMEKEKKALAKNASNQLKQTSPKDSGEYAKGWTTKKTANGYVVYNKKKPQLTHLLEKGHAKRGGGRVSGKPHIEPIEQNVIKDFQSRVESIIRNGGK